MNINNINLNRINSENLIKKTHKLEEKEDKELMDVCKDFESIFLYMMLKEMKESIPKDGLIERSSAMETFEDMYLDELSREISKDENSIGLAREMYNQLKRTMPYERVDSLDLRNRE